MWLRVRGSLTASALSLVATASLAWPQTLPERETIGRLVAAYPAHLDRIEGNTLIWRDGTRMAISDGRGPKTPAERLERADIADMLVDRYPAGASFAPPPVDFDPGRSRNAAFFDKMYGDCRKGEVRASLVEVVWLPGKWGKPLTITRINGVAEKLAAVSRELDRLPASFDAWLFPPAGTVNCRPIAGTDRTSAHGHGIAIDLAIARAHYWRWDRPATDGRRTWRNSVPREIVEVFERHGFIWGGRWHHYDTMHFEYRPELIEK